MIIALEGPRAVGKTTLLNNLSKTNPSIKIFHGYKYHGKHFELSKVDDFCANQLIYIRQKLEQYETLANNDINLITCGTEDIIFYTLNYPRIMGHDWTVETELHSWILSLQEKKSDAIIYLDATDEVILSRNRNDTRDRFNLENWLALWKDKMRCWFLSYRNCLYIDTSRLKAEEVAKKVHDSILDLQERNDDDKRFTFGNCSYLGS